MTRLRKMMLEELERRNYSEATTRCYIRTVEDFSRRFKRSPDCLGPEHIREYQAELFKKRKLSPGTVTQRLAALRFFYIKTLKKAWSIAETPYPKRALHFPSILSQEEVTRLIDSALTPYHRILLMTLYATGVRNAELTHLKVSDIDSKRMVPISRITGEVKSAYPINQGISNNAGPVKPFLNTLLSFRLKELFSFVFV